MVFKERQYYYGGTEVSTEFPCPFLDCMLSRGPSRYRVLIFSHFSETRDGVDLLKCLARALPEHNANPDHVIFTTYDERDDGSKKRGENVSPKRV